MLNHKNVLKLSKMTTYILRITVNDCYNLKSKESYLIIPFQTVVTFRIVAAGMGNVMTGHLFAGPAHVIGPTFGLLCADRVKE